MSPQAAYIMTDILARQHRPGPEPVLERAQDHERRRQAPPAALKTGTTTTTNDLTADGFVAPPKDQTKPAIVDRGMDGQQRQQRAAGGRLLARVPAPLWQAFMNEVTKKLPIANFSRPAGIVEATVDA